MTLTLLLVLLFWLCLGLIIYTYVGYGFIVWLLVSIRDLFVGRKAPGGTESELPMVTIVVPAYNEKAYIDDKLKNCLEQNYPAHLVQFLFVAEGSTDGTISYLTEKAKDIPRLTVVGGAERLGKVAAMNKAMKMITTPVVIFTDANTLLNPDAIQKLGRHFANPLVGAVSGEKRIVVYGSENAAGAGEGFYWKYESFLKRLDSRLYSVVGAAGELLAIRSSLYSPIETDTLLDDFVLSLRIAAQGYQVVYEPEACARERPSDSTGEEQKRKVRIAAGGFQAMMRLKFLLNIFRFGWLTFQYVSHRVLRWAVAPFCLVFALALNVALVGLNAGLLYEGLLVAQVCFYLFALLGYWLESRRMRIKALFVPYYFTFMNWCVLLGYVHFQRGIRTGIWEKTKRAI